MTQTLGGPGIATRINGTAPPEVPLSEIDLGSSDFWAQGDDVHDGAFATLRREAPISFHDEPEWPGVPRGNGHWALTRLDDLRHVSRHPEIFRSSPTSHLTDQEPEIAEFYGSLLALDDPRHGRLRALMSRAFTPKVVARIEDSIRERARLLVSEMIATHPGGQCDLVSEVAGRLPLQVICDMMGIPEEDHQKIFHWSNLVVGAGDPDFGVEIDEFLKMSVDFGGYGLAMVEDRRSNPRDDLTTNLVRAEENGERLTSSEIASFFILLGAAGSETTRNAISHGVVALSRYPDERARWWADFDAMAPTAVDEIVRWASPVHYMRRTATKDTEISGTRIRCGEKVSMWYGSANRDELKFRDPWTFDPGRTPNPHVGYGAGGVHFCLGANLARREITAAFSELHRQIPDIVAVDEPAMLQSAFIHGVKRLPVAWTPPD